MILSYLIFTLSLFSPPLALGRPASAPTHEVYQPAALAEPNALLGRHYIVHDHRDAAHPYTYTYTVSPTTASHRVQQTPRHTKPFARYFADRSGDIWVHERPRAPVPILIPRVAADDEARRKYVNYVSHVGPFAYEPPPPPPPPTTPIAMSSQPFPTLAEYDELPSTSTASPETTLPVMNLAAANATTTSNATHPYPTTEATEPSKSKKIRAKVRAKLHKSGKKEYKERRKC